MSDNTWFSNDFASYRNCELLYPLKIKRQTPVSEIYLDVTIATNNSQCALIKTEDDFGVMFSIWNC